MKKRFSIPLGLIGLLILIGFWGIKQHEEELEAANAGDMEACAGVIKSAFFDDLEPGSITNEECKSLVNKARGQIAQDNKTPSYVRKPGVSDYQNCLNLRDEVNAVQAGLGDKSYDCESIKSFVKPADRVKAARKQNLARSCEDQFRPNLHDPRSYRYVDKKFIATGDNGLDITVTYSATNKLGGRIQSTHTCNFTF